MLDWKHLISDFSVIDVRGISENFFPGLKKRAEKLEVGKGLTVIQTFDPTPLYPVMENLGFEYFTEEVSKNEYRAYFYRTKINDKESDIIMRPVSLTNFPIIDEDLGKLAVEFWDLTWNDSRRTLSMETRLMLSMANAIGAGRIRQATRELVKLYAHGTGSDSLKDIFELVVWNQGIGYFSSEISNSVLFKAFKAIINKEKQGLSREEVLSFLLENFGDKNPDVKVQ